MVPTLLLLHAPWPPTVCLNTDPAAAIVADGNIGALNVAVLGKHVLQLLPGVGPWDALDNNLCRMNRMHACVCER